MLPVPMMMMMAVAWFILAAYYYSTWFWGSNLAIDIIAALHWYNLITPARLIFIVKWKFLMYLITQHLTTMWHLHQVFCWLYQIQSLVMMMLDSM
jgi:hypothetical protein